MSLKISYIAVFGGKCQLIVVALLGLGPRWSVNSTGEGDNGHLQYIIENYLGELRTQSSHISLDDFNKSCFRPTDYNV